MDPEAVGWRARAACRDTDPDVFFPPGGRAVGRALLICAGCPVREPCLDLALEAESEIPRLRYGVFGGLTPRERGALWVREEQAS